MVGRAHPSHTAASQRPAMNTQGWNPKPIPDSSLWNQSGKCLIMTGEKCNDPPLPPASSYQTSHLGTLQHCLWHALRSGNVLSRPARKSISGWRWQAWANFRWSIACPAERVNTCLPIAQQLREYCMHVYTYFHVDLNSRGCTLKPSSIPAHEYCVTTVDKIQPRRKSQQWTRSSHMESHNCPANQVAGHSEGFTAILEDEYANTRLGYLTILSVQVLSEL